MKKQVKIGKIQNLHGKSKCYRNGPMLARERIKRGGVNQVRSAVPHTPLAETHKYNLFIFN